MLIFIQLLIFMMLMFFKLLIIVMLLFFKLFLLQQEVDINLILIQSQCFLVLHYAKLSFLRILFILVINIPVVSWFKLLAFDLWRLFDHAFYYFSILLKGIFQLLAQSAYLQILCIQNCIICAKIRIRIRFYTSLANALNNIRSKSFIFFRTLCLHFLFLFY